MYSCIKEYSQGKVPGEPGFDSQESNNVHQVTCKQKGDLAANRGMFQIQEKVILGKSGISSMCRHTEIRISVSEEDTVGTGKAPFFQEVGERGETGNKNQGVKIQNM